MRYKQATWLARVVLKADRVRERAILLARSRVRRMVRASEEEPRRRKDNSGSGGRRLRCMLMSQMEEGAAPDVAGACLGAVTAALARANDVLPDVAGADLAVAVAMVSDAPEAVPTIPDVESAPASIDQGV